jgi:ADP-heptose:LPS heptosyltransferase
MIVDLSGFKDYLKQDFEEFNLNLLHNTKRITIHREYALGDLLQLIAAARLIKKRYNIGEIWIVTNERFVDDLNYCFADIRFMSAEVLIHASLDFDFTFTIDGILERDHSLQNTENAKHRIEILLNYFGIETFDKSELDWSVNLRGGLVMPQLKNDKKIVGVQIRGSGFMKTLPTQMVKAIVNELAKKYYVALIDQDKDQGFEGTNILNLCGKLKPPQVIELLRRCSLCLTMDSGVLWMAHVANCPTLTFLGSTREHERISLHPQYPEKAKAIDLTKYVGCEPCFETRVRCKGAVNCMNKVSYDIIKDELLEKVKSILGD